MSDTNYVTQETFESMKEELHQLKSVERPEASKAIAEAREKGDLKENAEYDAAMKSERAYFNLVKTAFNQRRKTMRNAVKSLFDEDILKEDFFQKRAEVVTVEQFAALTFRMR